MSLNTGVLRIQRDVTPVSHFVADLILRLELPPPILDSDPDYGFLDPWESYQLPPISQPEKPIQTVENVHDEGSSQNQYSETRWHFNTQDDQFKSPHFHKTLHYEPSDPIVKINTTDKYLINHKKHPTEHDECDITSENAHFVDEKDYKNESSLSYDQNAGLAGAFAQMTLGVSRSLEQTALEEHMRKHAWEHGNADYMGVDSFDNIWKKICETLSTKDGEEESSALKNVSDSEPSSFSIEKAPMVVKTNLEELTPASPLQVPSSSKQTTITPPIEALVKPQKPESIKVVLPIHPEMESTDKLQSRKTDEQQEQKKEPVLVSSPLPLVSHSSENILSPSTPLVTEATPPTSPPIAPVAPKIDSHALVVETPPIETPPVSTDIPKFTAAKSTPESSSVESVKPSLAEQAPVPPKRRGAKGDSGKATVSQPSKGNLNKQY
ncbi:unnamed protein product, partial [Timema podura]|nr:unnamed protein product [Timema podura]